MEDLFFAQKFPFSEKSREYLKQTNISMEKLPEQEIRKAVLIISRANSKNDYKLDVANPTKEMLETEIIAFPIAKMIISVMRTNNIIQKFSELIMKKTLNELLSDKNTTDLSIELAKDLGIKFNLLGEEDVSFEVPLQEYLKIDFIDDETKLINKRVEEGKVYLNQNDFSRFLSEKAYVKVFYSLPIDKKAIPKELIKVAKSVDSQLVTIQQKHFDARMVGKIDPEVFPPCMKVLYADQLAGKKLSYLGRLALGAFLFQTGMQKQQMMELFSKSPDFKKHIAEYHVDRIFEKELSAPGCKKMAEYNLNVTECRTCKYKHPVQRYLSQKRVKNRLKNKENTK